MEHPELSLVTSPAPACPGSSWPQPLTILTIGEVRLGCWGFAHVWSSLRRRWREGQRGSPWGGRWRRNPWRGELIRGWGRRPIAKTCGDKRVRYEWLLPVAQLRRVTVSSEDILQDPAAGRLSPGHHPEETAQMGCSGQHTSPGHQAVVYTASNSSHCQGGVQLLNERLPSSRRPWPPPQDQKRSHH